MMSDHHIPQQPCQDYVNGRGCRREKQGHCPDVHVYYMRAAWFAQNDAQVNKARKLRLDAQKNARRVKKQTVESNSSEAAAVINIAGMVQSANSDYIPPHLRSANAPSQANPVHYVPPHLRYANAISQVEAAPVKNVSNAAILVTNSITNVGSAIANAVVYTPPHLRFAGPPTQVENASIEVHQAHAGAAKNEIKPHLAGDTKSISIILPEATHFNSGLASTLSPFVRLKNMPVENETKAPAPVEDTKTIVINLLKPAGSKSEPNGVPAVSGQAVKLHAFTPPPSVSEKDGGNVKNAGASVCPTPPASPESVKTPSDVHCRDFLQPMRRCRRGVQCPYLHDNNEQDRVYGALRAESRARLRQMHKEAEADTTMREMQELLAGPDDRIIFGAKGEIVTAATLAQIAPTDVLNAPVLRKVDFNSAQEWANDHLRIPGTQLAYAKAIQPFIADNRLAEIPYEMLRGDKNRPKKAVGVFEVFPQLPGELRNKIWAHAAEDQANEIRQVRVELKYNDAHWSSRMAPRILCRTPIPALLATSRDARAISLPYYEATFITNNPYTSHTLFNYASDRVFINSRGPSDFENFGKCLGPAGRKRIQHMALTVKELQRSPNLIERLSKNYRDLASLELIAGDSPRDARYVREASVESVTSKFIAHKNTLPVGLRGCVPKISVEIVSALLAKKWGIDKLEGSQYRPGPVRRAY